MKNADEPAYPCNANETYHTEDLDGEPVKQTHTRRVNGLTKRERFAMAAMQGFIAWGAHEAYCDDKSGVAESAVAYADALLAELEKTESP